MNMKLLVLTDINVSNIHLMMAEQLSQIAGWQVSFINVRTPTLIYNNSDWYEFKSECNQSDKLAGKNILSRLSTVGQMIREADVVFCSGAISYLVRLLRKPYIYFCYGSDLDQYAFYGASVFELKAAHVGKMRRLLRIPKKILYRESIKGANVTIIAPYQYETLAQIGYERLGFTPHILESDYLHISLEEKAICRARIQEQYDCDHILFSASRHVWNEKLKSEIDFKGNDIIIKAFHKLTNNSDFKRAKLFFIEKGQDTKASKEIIRLLGLEKKVVWLEPMNRKKLMTFYAGAHVCFDQFSRGCLALCAVESMACGTTTVTYIGELSSEVPFYSELPPVFNSKNSDEISTFLSKVLNDEQFRRKMEMDSYQWARKQCSYNRFIESFQTMVEMALAK
jgi:glycosyltransferase involved in cell wall biosynthesis